MRSYCHLSLDERRTIFRMLGAGKSKAEIANVLGRHRSTLFREVRRNSYYHEDHSNNGYFPVNAHEIASARREKLRKLLRHPALKEYVVSRLRDLWSPDQIAGYLNRMSIEGFYACHETIYAFVYSAEGRALNLYRFLRRGFKHRRKRFVRKPRHLRGIPACMAIEHRPAEIATRESFGHWEGDLMIFRREYGPVSLTSLVERKSRYTVLLKNQSRQSAAVVGQIREAMTALPAHCRRSITFDRGSEFMAWAMLAGHIELGSFYCDARSPWQKGTNENTNGLIRRYLPSETNLNEVTSSQIRAVCRKLNNTPRKCLDYRTPHEVFGNHLHQRTAAISCRT